MRASLAAVLLAASLSANAAGWTRASSESFDVYTNGTAKSARDIITEISTYHAFFERALNVPSRARQPGMSPARMVVFANAAEFAPFKPNATSDAFWLGTPDGDFIVMHSVTGGALSSVLHELTHLMVSRSGAVYPLWLNEGLAQFYSTMRTSGGKMRVGLAPAQFMNQLARGNLLPLDALFALGDQPAEAGDPRAIARIYAESWAFTHMLLSHDQYKGRARELFAAIAKGTSSADALLATYGKPVDKVDAEFRRYLTRFRFVSDLVPLPPRPANRQVTTADADADDVDVLLASIVGWQPGREGEGRAAMAAIEARGRLSVGLAEARGLLEMYTQHCDAAREYLGKAVSTGSRNAAVLRAYAQLIGPSDPDQRRALLAKAGPPAPGTAGGGHFVVTPCSAGR
jgi:hypothetical protein